MLREISIPIAIFAILASFLLPLPGFMIDALLVVNLLFALVLLVSALYISEPLRLSSLPTMLLLATLYRLALNVSTTRLILTSGQAGQVIEAFGEVVIQGNIIVGIVVFLIITLIQFLVIAKGAERVAEVAARFTLDALPGKQMSIDADVRAGLIDFETARTRRQELQTESRFYGALDGAMKFVKGDAIAGLIITGINIGGGLLVGTIMFGLGLKQALLQYTILTIGDGLASQLPALLNALAAGIIVTRVIRGDGECLAYELPRQLGQLRSVKVIVGLAALAFTMVPHMPVLPFILLSGAFLIPAVLMKEDSDAGTKEPSAFQPRIPAVLLIELEERVAREFRALGRLNRDFDIFRQKIFEQKGLILNAPEFSINHDLQNEFRIRMRGVTVSKISYSGNARELCQIVLKTLEKLVLSRCGEFVDDILTRRTLDRFDKEAPELVAAVVPGIISVTQLTEILRALLAEKVTIRNFDLILQAIAESSAKVRNERAILEEVRVALKRIICAELANADGKIFAYALSPIHDLAFAAAERESKIVDLSVLDEIVSQVSGQDSKGIVIVTSKAARRFTREALQIRSLIVDVLAYDELSEDIDVEYIGTLGANSPRHEELLESLAA